MSRFVDVPLRRAWLAAAAVLTLAACGDGNDGSGAPFSADGTASDMNAVSASFSTPAMASLGWAAGSIDGVFGAAMVSTTVGAIHDAAPRSGNLAATARRLVRASAAFNGGPVRDAALLVIPVEVLGTTFEYNGTSGQYEATARTGAPTNGVRFILYAVNPVTRVPVEPLTEAGYADVLDQSTATADAVRLQLVSGGVTYLDYGVTGSVTATTGHAVVDGYVTDGTTRVNFDLDNSYSDANGSAAFDYRLDAPSLDVALHYTLGLSQLSGAAAIADIDIALAGPHGDVGIEGQLVEGVGVLTATVNGGPFALVTLGDYSDVTSITKPDGSALSAPEYGALAAIWGAVLKGLDLFEDLLDPVDHMF